MRDEHNMHEMTANVDDVGQLLEESAEVDSIIDTIRRQQLSRVHIRRRSVMEDQHSSAASDGSVSPRSYGGASPRSAPRSAAAMVNTPRSGPLSPPRYRHVGASGFFDEPLARMSERSGSSADARMSKRISEV